MTCDWCGFPGTTVLHVESVREQLCDQCVALVAHYGIANVRL